MDFPNRGLGNFWLILSITFFEVPLLPCMLLEENLGISKQKMTTLISYTSQLSLTREPLEIIVDNTISPKSKGNQAS